MDRLKALSAVGVVSIWLDDLSRGWLTSGTPAEMVADYQLVTAP